MATRSRSPIRAFSTKNMPEVKTWVLVRTETKRGRGRSSALWSRAVPALVSQVAKTSKIGIDEHGTEVRVNVLVPNLLVLQHAFRGSSHKEIQELPLTAIRPYYGKDITQLKEALLKSIRDVAHARMRERTEQDDRNVREQDEDAVVPPDTEQVGPDGDEQERLIESPIAELPKEDEDAVVPPDTEQVGPDGDEQERLIESPIAELPKEDTAAAKVETRVEPLADTPKPKRSLVRTVTPPNPALPEADVVVPACAAKPKLTKAKLQEFTRTIAQAFMSAREDMLTREQISDECAFVGSTAELDEALAKLEERNKIFISGNLIFRV